MKVEIFWAQVIKSYRIKREGKRGCCRVGHARRMLGSEGHDLAQAHNATFTKEVGVKPSFLGFHLHIYPLLLDFLEVCLLLLMKSLLSSLSLPSLPFLVSFLFQFFPVPSRPLPFSPLFSVLLCFLGGHTVFFLWSHLHSNWWQHCTAVLVGVRKEGHSTGYPLAQQRSSVHPSIPSN